MSYGGFLVNLMNAFEGLWSIYNNCELFHLKKQTKNVHIFVFSTSEQSRTETLWTPAAAPRQGKRTYGSLFQGEREVTHTLTNYRSNHKYIDWQGFFFFLKKKRSSQQQQSK